MDEFIGYLRPGMKQRQVNPLVGSGKFRNDLAEQKALNQHIDQVWKMLKHKHGKLQIKGHFCVTWRQKYRIR